MKSNTGIVLTENCRACGNPNTDMYIEPQNGGWANGSFCNPCGNEIKKAIRATPRWKAIEEDKDRSMLPKNWETMDKLRKYCEYDQVRLENTHKEDAKKRLNLVFKLKQFYWRLRYDQ